MRALTIDELDWVSGGSVEPRPEDTDPLSPLNDVYRLPSGEYVYMEHDFGETSNTSSSSIAGTSSGTKGGGLLGWWNSMSELQRSAAVGSVLASIGTALGIGAKTAAQKAFAAALGIGGAAMALPLLFTPTTLGNGEYLPPGQ